jgi:stage II sporulation protein D
VRSGDVFGGSDGITTSTPCGPCADGAAPAWSLTLSSRELDGLARRFELGSELLGIQPVTLDPAGRWLTVALRGSSAEGIRRVEELRRELGYDRLPSGRILRTWPAPGERIAGGLYVAGRGSGHGVGLCQRGSHGYGELGWSAEQILDHYFRGARIVVR